MQITTITTVVIAALTASVSAAVECYSQKNAMTKWFLKADGVDNYSELCGKLWEQLKIKDGCEPAYEPDCGERDGRLRWVFKGLATCSGNDVRDTWYAATNHRLGWADCK